MTESLPNDSEASKEKELSAEQILLLQIGFLNRELEYANSKRSGWDNNSGSNDEGLLTVDQNEIPSFTWFVKDRYKRYRFFKDSENVPEKALEQVGKLTNLFAYNILYIHKKLHPNLDPNTTTEEVLQLIYETYLKDNNIITTDESKTCMTPFTIEIDEVPKYFQAGELQKALESALLGCIKALHIWKDYYIELSKNDMDISVSG